MVGEEIGLREINEIFREERKRKLLLDLPTDFYTRCLEYISSLESSIQEEEGTGGQNPKAMMLKEERERAKEFVGKIYGERQRKILILAHNKFRGAQVDITPLTGEEQVFFEGLFDMMKENMDATLGPNPVGRKRLRLLFSRRHKKEEKTLSRETKSTAKSAPREDLKAPAAASSTTSLDAPLETPRIEEMGEKPPEEKEFATVLVLEDLPSLMGPDAIYELAAQDIAALPKSMAALLEKQGKVRFVEGA
ncbi:MAG: DNA replication complex GINS family protein [Thermoplasmata archaeon]|nr:DNA replication complex GINS family protein [Thermoplasmata archaeon]